MRVQYPNEQVSNVAPKYQREHAAMTLAQASYLMTLCEETHQVLDDSLTQAEAARRIAELEDATGRSSSHGSSRTEERTTSK